MSLTPRFIANVRYGNCMGRKSSISTRVTFLFFLLALPDSETKCPKGKPHFYRGEIKYESTGTAHKPILER